MGIFPKSYEPQAGLSFTESRTKGKSRSVQRSFDLSFTNAEKRCLSCFKPLFWELDENIRYSYKVKIHHLSPVEKDHYLLGPNVFRVIL